MKSDLFLEFFPVPDYLQMPAVGFDLSDQSVKFVELNLDGHVSLNRFGEKSIPMGVIEEGKIKNKEQIISILKSVKEEFGFTNIFASLPEDSAYIVRMKLPPMRDEEIRNSIELQLEEYVPIPAENCVFDYEEIVVRDRQTEEVGIEVSVTVVPREVVNDYLEIFQTAGFNPLAFEIEAQSIARSLIPHKDPHTYMLVDIGKTHTGFATVASNQIVFSSLIGMGGDNITNAIARSLGVSSEEAEKLKAEKGLLRSEENKEVFLSLVPAISALRDEIQQRCLYWQSFRDDKKEVAHNPIDKIILCGGQSTLLGLKEYLEIQLKIPVVVGNPWTNFSYFYDRQPPIDFNNAMRYATSLGLALRNLKK